MIPIQLQSPANYLWQSTLFAAVAGLLTLALRKSVWARSAERSWYGQVTQATVRARQATASNLPHLS